MAASASTQPQFMTSMGNGNSSSNAPLIENTDSNQIVVPDPKFFGILSEAYVLYVRAKGHGIWKFENAAAAAEKAWLIDFNNMEVAMLLNNVKLVSRARSQGKDLFSAGKFTEACSAYGEGLKYDLCNSILYCNRAVCWSKLGLWEQSVEDCNHALKQNL